MEKERVLEYKQVTAPQLRFPEFKSAYKDGKFGEVVESNIYGPRFNAKDYSENGNVKTIRGTDLGSDGEIKYSQVPVAQLDEKMIATHRLQEGDLVMITTAECGSTAVFRQKKIDYLSSAYGVRIRLKKSGYPYYFKYFFQTRLAKKEINSFIRKATVANLPGSDILKIKCPIPSLPEQQKIASFLSAVDKKIQQLTLKKELLETYKTGVMQQLFSQKIRFKPVLSGAEGDEDGKDFPEWEEKKLGEIATFSKGKGVSKNDVTEDGITPCIRYGQLYTDYKETIDVTVSRTNLPDELLVLSEAGDVIIPASGETRIDIATASCVVNEGIAFGGDLNIIRGDFKGVFLAYYLNAHLKTDIARLSQGSSVIHLYANQLKKLRLEIPAIKEQEKIADFLSAIDKKIDAVSQQNEKTQQFKKGLLQQMFV